MGWEDYYRFPLYRPEDIHKYPISPFKVNEKCFIRKDHKCGKIFGASKACFVACPSEDIIEPILELISEKLAKVGIEAIIAVKERAYGQDIFCTKICGKIIESKFCLVILDDSIEADKNIPNPNVYYEYGLMTSLEKHIIPLQKEDLKLAFNIQSYDTIKYSSKNIGTELDRAIKDAIKITDEKRKPGKKFSLAERSILRSFELGGFDLKDDEWFLWEVIEDTQFKGFGQHEQKFYVYLGKIDGEKEISSYLEDINVVVFRTEKKFKERKEMLKNDEKNVKNLEKQKKEMDVRPTSIRIARLEDNMRREKLKIEEDKSKIKLMSLIYFAFIINPEIDRGDFVKKAEELISKNDRYKLVCSSDSEIAFGDIKLNLSFNP